MTNGYHVIKKSRNDFTYSTKISESIANLIRISVKQAAEKNTNVYTNAQIEAYLGCVTDESHIRRKIEESPISVIYGDIDENNIMACGHLFPKESKAEVVGFYVHPHLKRQGIGTLIYEKIEDYARKHTDYTCLHAECLLFPQTIKFWEKMEFVKNNEIFVPLEDIEDFKMFAMEKKLQ